VLPWVLSVSSEITFCSTFFLAGIGLGGFASGRALDLLRHPAYFVLSTADRFTGKGSRCGLLNRGRMTHGHGWR
jgi:hypothetical protein